MWHLLLDAIVTARAIRAAYGLFSFTQGVMDMDTYGMVSTPAEGPWIVFRELGT